MARFYYLVQHLDFLRDAYPKLSIDDLTAAFNKAFCLDKTPAQIKSAVKNHGIKCGRKCGSSRLRAFTTEQRQFCVEQYQKLSVNELAEVFNRKFKTEKTTKQLRAFLKNQKIRSGRTGHFDKDHVPHNKGVKGWQSGGRSSETHFKKGRSAANVRPIGSERTNVEGYIEVKVEEPNIWRAKQRVIYELALGPIPKGFNIRFKNGDKTNFDLDNLVAVSNSTNMYMTHNGYKDTNDELKETVFVMSELQSKVKRLGSKA